MRRHSASYRKLLATALIWRASPDDAGTVADMLGVRDQFAPPSGSPRSFVYLLDTHDLERTRYFKIGRSIQPHVRLQQIQSGTGAAMPPMWQPGTPVRPFAIREGGAGVEATIHRDLREYRLTGTEWFVGDLAVARYIVAQDVWDSWRGASVPGNYDFAA